MSDAMILTIKNLAFSYERITFFYAYCHKKKKKVIQITNYTRMTLTVKNERNILLGGTMLQLFLTSPPPCYISIILESLVSLVS